MRVLFTVIPDRSLFQSMVPLAWALRTAGHEVRFASQPRFAAEIASAGLTAVPVGRNIDITRLNSFLGDELETYRHGLPAPWNAAVEPAASSWEDQLYRHLDAVDDAHKPDNFPMIAGLVSFARAWRPDLVVWEPLTYAGPIAAKASGAAHVRLLWSLDVFGATRHHYLNLKRQQPPAERYDPLATWLGAYARRYGGEFSEDMTTGHATIDQLPPSVALHAPSLDYLTVRYVPYNGPSVVPAWLRAAPARPRIAVTLGITSSSQFAGYAIDLGDILRALDDPSWEVVATVPDVKRAKLGPVPGNVRVTPFVPLNALVPTCAAVVDHAGPGTLLTTAWHGVPQLTVPYDFDEPELARRAARQGAALCVRATDATGEVVRAGLRRVLAEPAFADGARRLRTEIRSQPSPNDLVPRLEELVEKHRCLEPAPPPGPLTERTV